MNGQQPNNLQNDLSLWVHIKQRNIIIYSIDFF